jgi:hypothetical protein
VQHLNIGDQGKNKSVPFLLSFYFQRGQLTANGKFARELSEKIGRRLEPRGPGRPRKGGK